MQKKRLDKIVSLWQEGHNYSSIARQMHISRQRIHSILEATDREVVVRKTHKLLPKSWKNLFGEENEIEIKDLAVKVSPFLFFASKSFDKHGFLLALNWQKYLIAVSQVLQDSLDTFLSVQEIKEAARVLGFLDTTPKHCGCLIDQAVVFLGHGLRPIGLEIVQNSKLQYKLQFWNKQLYQDYLNKFTKDLEFIAPPLEESANFLSDDVNAGVFENPHPVSLLPWVMVCRNLLSDEQLYHLLREKRVTTNPGDDRVACVMRQIVKGIESKKESFHIRVNISSPYRRLFFLKRCRYCLYHLLGWGLSWETFAGWKVTDGTKDETLFKLRIVDAQKYQRFLNSWDAVPPLSDVVRL